MKDPFQWPKVVLCTEEQRSAGQSCVRNNFGNDLFGNIPMWFILTGVPWFNMSMVPSGANIEGFFKIREYIHFIFNIEAIAPEIMQSRYDEQENS